MAEHGRRRGRTGQVRQDIERYRLPLVTVHDVDSRSFPAKAAANPNQLQPVEDMRVRPYTETPPVIMATAANMDREAGE